MAESMVERVAKAIAQELGLDLATLYANKSEWNRDRGARHDINTPYRGDITAAARAAIQALRDQTCVYRHGGEVIHELRGAPDDIWKALLDAALTQDTEG